MKILGLIPARGGSKGIPGKNIRKLNGIPLLAYTADAAKKSSALTSLIVSTDDEDIIQLAKQYGIDAPFTRPAILASDTATSLAVIKHAIHFFEEKQIFFDAVCLLQPTYPFRVAKLIDQCIEKFIQTKSDTLFTTIPVPPEYNPHWVFEMNSDEWLTPAIKDKTMIDSRQSLPKAFIRDGAVYLFKTSLVKEHDTLYGQQISRLQTDENWYVNIDTLKDWEIAEKKAPLFLQTYPLSLSPL